MSFSGRVVLPLMAVALMSPLVMHAQSSGSNTSGSTNAGSTASSTGTSPTAPQPKHTGKHRGTATSTSTPRANSMDVPDTPAGDKPVADPMNPSSSPEPPTPTTSGPPRAPTTPPTNQPQ
ncbi:hypothetical protein [Terriglobus sp. RCC_193]|uniref:hypothetical protein n=1 Tax=Terriglobus sp. RCC_193 TaxID=3239218 RepID=UPI003523AFE8